MRCVHGFVAGTCDLCRPMSVSVPRYSSDRPHGTMIGDDSLLIGPIDVAGEVWRRRYEAYNRAPLKRPFNEQLKEWNERDVALLTGENKCR